MIMLLTHARGHFNEDLVFARFGDVTLAEFERLANLSDEDRFLLSCHVVLVFVSAFPLLSTGCYAIISSRYTPRPDTYTNITAVPTCNVASLLTNSHSQLIPNVEQPSSQDTDAFKAEGMGCVLLTKWS